MSTKVITLEQLRTVVMNIKEWLNDKISKSEEIPVDNGIVFKDRVHMDYDMESHSIMFTVDNGDNTSSVTLPLPSADGSSTVAFAEGGNEFEADLLHTQAIVVGSGESMRLYAFPSSNSLMKSRCIHPEYGGGAILTTRYRSFYTAVHNIADGDSGSVNLIPNVYTIVNMSGDTLVFDYHRNDTGNVDEYWIELNVNSRFDIAFGEEIRFAGDVPDTASGGLVGKTVQIHIINNIASYCVLNQAVE